MATRTEKLICTCCGSYTRGRQWWNRDTGYGLCPDCVDFCKKGVSSAEEFELTYGKENVNYFTNEYYKNKSKEN